MKHVKKRSYIKEKQQKKDYAGTEASPYREWLSEKGDYNQDHEAKEPAEANPDVLADSQAFYPIKAILTEGQEDQMEMIQDAWTSLTLKQREVVQLVGHEGRTLENCAALMGISRGNVLDLLNRARKKILQKSKIS